MRRFAILLLALLAGCQSARYVSKGPDEGVIALPADTPRHRQRAEELMAAHFPAGYEIVFEEEVKVGSVTRHQASTHYHERVEPDKYELSAFDEMQHAAVMDAFHSSARPPVPPVVVHPSTRTTAGAHSQGTTTTRNQTEWRIRYRRKRAEDADRGSPSRAGQSISDFPVPRELDSASSVRPAFVEETAADADVRPDKAGSARSGSTPESR